MAFLILNVNEKLTIFFTPARLHTYTYAYRSPFLFPLHSCETTRAPPSIAQSQWIILLIILVHHHLFVFALLLADKNLERGVLHRVRETTERHALFKDYTQKSGMQK